jgi:hypothetical protein
MHILRGLDKYYFAHEMRAYSHGCMRVQDPAKYAEVLLNIARPQEHWTAERIKRMFGSSEQDLQLQPTPIWVHLTYQTAFVDSAGKLQMRRDIYNLDSRTLAAIKSELIAYAKANPGKVSMASFGAAPCAHWRSTSFDQPAALRGIALQLDGLNNPQSPRKARRACRNFDFTRQIRNSFWPSM